MNEKIVMQLILKQKKGRKASFFFNNEWKKKIYWDWNLLWNLTIIFIYYEVPTFSRKFDKNRFKMSKNFGMEKRKSCQLVWSITRALLDQTWRKMFNEGLPQMLEVFSISFFLTFLLIRSIFIYSFKLSNY